MKNGKIKNKLPGKHFKKLLVFLSAAAFVGTSIGAGVQSVYSEDLTETQVTTELESTSVEAAQLASQEKYPAFERSVELDGVTVSVVAEEGVFPEDSWLSVEKVSKDDQKRIDAAVEKVREDDLKTAVSYTYDIKVFNKENEEMHPAEDEKVRVSFSVEEIVNSNLTAQIYHISDDMKAEASEVKIENDTAYVVSEGLSYYTLEFTYDQLQYALEGNTVIALKTIRNALGIKGSKASAVEVSGSTLFSTYEENGLWMISVNKHFSSREWLKVTIDGIVYEIEVKDYIFKRSADVNGVTVTVQADDGAFPEDAWLSVKRITKNEQKKVDAAIEEVRDDNVNTVVSYTYDIKMYNKDNEEIQPADNKKVRVSFATDEVTNKNLDTKIYHVEGEKALYATKLDVQTEGDTAAAVTSGFSYYTVEFTYDDKQYVMEGDGSVKLSNLLETVGLSGEVSSYEISNTELFNIFLGDEDEIDYDYTYEDETEIATPKNKENGTIKYMVALQAFDTEEWLDVTIDGVTYRIIVTDDAFVNGGGTNITDPRVVQGENETNFIDAMPLATIWVDESIVNTYAYTLADASVVEASLVYSGTRKGMKINTARTIMDGGVEVPNPRYGQLYFDFTESGAALSYGTHTRADDNVWAGEVVQYKIKNGGEWFNPQTEQSEKLDLVITYSNIHIALQEHLSGPTYNTFDHLNILDTNRIQPQLYTNTANAASNSRAGLIYDVNVKFVDKNGKLVDGSFYFPLVDMDVERGNGFDDIYGAQTYDGINDNHNDNYSEHVMMIDNYGMPISRGAWTEKIWIPGGDYDSSQSSSQVSNMPYLSNIVDCDGNLVVKPGAQYAGITVDGYVRPTPNSAGKTDTRDEDFYTGFATLGNNTQGGIDLRIWGSSANNAKNTGSGTVTSFIIAGNRINHKVAASSDKGGTIYTTSSNNSEGDLSNGDIMGDSAINSPYEIAVATGQSVTYTMTPKLGYKISKVYVKNDDIDVLTDKTGHEIPLSDLTNVDNGKYYTYKFNGITENKSIHVEWVPSKLEVKKEVTGSDAETFKFRIKITPPNGYSSENIRYRARALSGSPTSTVTRYTFTPQEFSYTGQYLIYDQVQKCFVGWDRTNNTWKQLPITPENGGRDLDLTGYVWQTQEVPCSYTDTSPGVTGDDRLMYNTDVGLPTGQSAGTPIIWNGSNYVLSVGGISPSNYTQAGTSPTDYYIQPPAANSPYTLSFYWDGSKYQYRSYESTGHKSIIFYSYSTAQEQIFTDLDYKDLSVISRGDGKQYVSLAGGGADYIITLPRSTAYGKAQLQSDLNNASIAYDDCEVFPIDDTTESADLISEWNATHQGNTLSLVSGTTDTYEFSLSYDGTNNPSVNFETIVPFGWNYEAWEVDKDGNKVNVNDGFQASSSGLAWQLTEQSNTTKTNFDGDESVTFKNIRLHDLTVSKTVTGNQGSRNKYFKFGITVNARAGTILTLDSSNLTTTGSGTGYPDTETVYTVNEIVTANNKDDDTSSGATGQQINANQTFYIYMKDGQSFTLSGLPEGATYMIVEEREDYTASADLTAGDDKNRDDGAGTGTVITLEDGNKIEDNYIKGNAVVKYTNNRSVIVPTGTESFPWYWVVVTGVLAGGVVVYLIKRIKDKADKTA